MKDSYNREITGLRISVTQKCNLNCLYCHREGERDNGEEMSFDKFKRIIDAFLKNGISKIKITGGEPLLREDVIEMIRYLRSKKKFEDISLTTNGTLLEKLAYGLKKAGLNRVNIGCDSLSSNIFPKNVESIKDGLLAARKAGLNPIKLNMVVLKGLNDQEIDCIINFAKQNQVILQLIELIDIDHNFYEKYYYNLDDVERELEKKAKRIFIRKMHHRKQYDLGGVIVEMVKPSHKIFCQHCHKIRVTSDGKLKPCLMRSDNLVQFKNEYSIIEAINNRGIFYD